MSFAVRPAQIWCLRTRSLPLGERTMLMGILNVTPDSFSDGNAWYSAEGTPDRAVDQAMRMLEDGADLLDIGGESTRPGAVAVTAEEEQARILPVIEAILHESPRAVLSVDTYHAQTARHALAAGVEIVNDVSGLMWDPAMTALVAQEKAGLVLMHARGTPQQWATLPPLPPEAVLPTVMEGLATSIDLARRAGVDAHRIVLDPGFGFGKRGAENYTLHAELSHLQKLGFPILVGTSRKGFLAARNASAEVRLSASMASNVAAILAGAHLIRTHDVLAARTACDVADAILSARTPC